MRSSIGFAALLLANDNSKFRHAVVAGSEHAARERLDRLFKQRPLYAQSSTGDARKSWRKSTSSWTRQPPFYEQLPPNSELRRREHLTEAEVERLIKAAFPNAWSKKLGVRAARAELTERSQRYQQFFQAVIDELRQKYRFTNAQVARPGIWYAFASGTTGILYGGTFAGGSRLRAELYIDMGDASRNKVIFDWLYAQRAQIEQKTGNLEWERLDDRRASRISLVRPDTTIDDFGTQATEMKEWLVQALLKIKSAFGPLLESLPHEVAKADAPPTLARVLPTV